MPDPEHGFLTHLAETPTDDVARGAYADWLDDHNRPDDAYRQRARIAVRPVLLDPDDTDLRLEFADWAEGQGRHDRAALIRTQLALAAKPLCPDWCDHDPARCERTRLVLLAMDLLAPCVVELRGPVGCSLTTIMVGHGVSFGWGAVVGGFIERLEIPGPVWIDHAEWLTAHHPVRRVHLTTAPEVEVLSMVGNGGICCFHRSDDSTTPPVGVRGTFDGVRASAVRILCGEYWPGIRITLA